MKKSVIILLCIAFQFGALAQFHVYFGDTGLNNIRRMSADGSEVETIMEINTVRELEINPYTDKLWFIDNDLGNISRCDLDGSNIEVMVDGLTSPSDITLDHDNQRIFYSSSGTNQIFVANFDGSDPTVIMDGDGKPIHVELECGSNHIYWCDYENGRIVRTADDGSDSEDFLTGLEQPRDLEIDEANGWIYWVEGGDVNQLRRADLNAENIQNIYQLDGNLGSIEIDDLNHKIYLLDLYASRLYRMDMDGTNVETLFSSFSNASNIAVVSCEVLCSSEQVDWCGTQPFVVEMDTLVETGIYTYVYDAVSGCDSIHTVHLTIENPVEIGLENEYQIGPEGMLDLSLSNDFVNVEWSDGTEGNDFQADAVELGIGSHEFTVTAESSLHSCQLSWTFTIVVNETTAVSLIGSGSFSLYPNPVASRQALHVRFDDQKVDSHTISFYTIQGKLIKQVKNHGSLVTDLIAPFSPGVYMLHIQGRDWHSTSSLQVLGQ